MKQQMWEESEKRKEEDKKSEKRKQEERRSRRERKNKETLSALKGSKVSKQCVFVNVLWLRRVEK